MLQEAYRVIKPGGEACLIGPVHPTFPISRFFADAWMLFPTEQEYIDWFTAAGFEDVKITRIGPKWYRGVRRHGLIMGCSVTGRKSKVRLSDVAHISRVHPVHDCSLRTAPLSLRHRNHAQGQGPCYVTRRISSSRHHLQCHRWRSLCRCLPWSLRLHTTDHDTWMEGRSLCGLPAVHRARSNCSGSAARRVD